MNINKFLSSTAVFSPPESGGGGAPAADAGGADKGGAGGADKGGAGGADKGSGGGGDPWYSALKPDADASKFLTERNFPDFNTLVKSAVSADKMARDRNVLAKPDPAKLGEWDGWKDLGWEPDAKKYTIGDPKNVKEGIIVDKGLQAHIAKAAHEMKMPLAMAQDLYESTFGYFVDMIDKAATKGAADMAKLQTDLDGKWAADKDRNTTLANRAVAFAGINADERSAIEKAIGGPRLLEIFYNYGKTIGEENLVANTGGGGVGESAATLDGELKKLEASQDFKDAMDDPRHPRRRDLIAQRQTLINRLAAAQPR